MTLVQRFEAAMVAAGLPVPQPRTTMEPFHSTLGVVDGTKYPVDQVLSQINSAVPVFTPIPITIANFVMGPFPIYIFTANASLPIDG